MISVSFQPELQISMSRMITSRRNIPSDITFCVV